MCPASNTLAARRGLGIPELGRGVVRLAHAISISVAMALAACQLASADELQRLVSPSLTSGLIDVSGRDIDAADRALAASRAPGEVLVVNRRTVAPPVTGSAMGHSMSSSILRPAMRRVVSRDPAVRASAREVSDILPLSRAAFPLLVGDLADDMTASSSSSASSSSASLRPLTGPVVGVRSSSFVRPGVAENR